MTHLHGDHFDTNTLLAVAGTSTAIVAPPTVFALMPPALQAITTVMTNGAVTTLKGIQVQAIPAYNTTAGRLNFHPQGRDNGYVLTLGGKRVYISGDTEDTPEMRALTNIDVAFLCMALPFTMDVNQAASAVAQFKPKVVYPYHYRNVKTGEVQDITQFQALVGDNLGTEVRLRTWYAPLEIGDDLSTSQSNAVLRAVHHATLAIQWNGETIYSDPAGGTAGFAGYPTGDLILVTHIHGDHFDTNSLAALTGTNTAIIAPSNVFAAMPPGLQAITTVMTNGAVMTLKGIQVQAIPAYNTTAGRLNFHPQGRDNGYVLTLGGKRVYISGDTEDTPEMRALTNIDVAFLCMNLPFTMDVNQAARAVRQFRPSVVYPYHFVVPKGGLAQDVTLFKQLVGTDLGIEVRFRPWYADYLP